MFDGLGFKKCPKKSKPDDWWAYSPFHKERTPSFHMGPGGLWYDFSVGEGGGALELVQRLFQLRDARMKGKKSKTPESVILSHIGRAVSDDQQPKYLFYEGFHKSAELLGQDRCWLDLATIDQIKQLGFLLLTVEPITSATFLGPVHLQK